jgi:PAS domain S-box-containing protein
MRRTAWLLSVATLPLLVGGFASADFSLVAQAVAGLGPVYAFLEMFTVVVVLMIFGIAWNAYSGERPGNILVLAAGLLAVGMIDFGNVLSWPGMPDLVTRAGPGKADYFESASRLVAAATLLAIALRRWKPVVLFPARLRLLVASAALTGVVYWIGLYHPDLLPPTFVPVTGMTPFKLASEYFIIALLLVAGLLSLRRARWHGSVSALWLFTACALFILSDLCLIRANGADGLFHVLENGYEIAAFAVLYRAVFVAAVRKPFERLSRARADLERANAEVKRVNVELERRVADRTANLDRANASLHESVTRVESILDTAADGIFSIDAHGIVETFNRAAELIFGYPASEVIGHNVTMLMPAASRTFHEGRFNVSRTAGDVLVSGRATEVVARRKDGSIFPMELSVSEMRLDGEDHFTVVGRDITARRLANDQLRKLSLALEQSPESILITDLDGRIEYVNAGFVLATGYPREEVIGRNPRFLQSGNTPPETYVAMWDALRKRQSWRGEFYNRRKDGSEYAELAVITPLEQPDGSVTHYVAVKEDITQRKRLEAELDGHRNNLEELVLSRTRELSAARQQAEAANHAKSSFLATMSHEIRTPLGGLMGMLELLSVSSLADDDRETVEAARDSGRGLLRILNDVLDWSKIEEGKLELAPQSTFIAALLTDVVHTYAQVASAGSVTVAQHVDERLSPALMVDPLRLSQVLNNFLSNAIKFNNRGGRVELRAELVARREQAEVVKFSVEDSGIGIDPQTRSRLFQNYGQANADTARMYGGTGLGLAICQRLADLMEGRIDVASELGRGSTFSITLTLQPAKSVAAPAPQSMRIKAAASAWPITHGAAAADAPLVLVVDDHPTNRKLLARQLLLLGLRVDTAPDGKEALALWHPGRYALVITDCHMPGLDGYELAHAIREIEADQALARTPIFGWTANALSDETSRCAQAGMDEVLIKPVDFARLQVTLKKWLPAASRPAPAPPKAPTMSVLDLTALNVICDGDTAAIRENLLEFRRVNEQDAVRLRQAVMEGDLEQVANASHRMLGSSSIVGARDLAEACRHIENASRSRDSESVANGMPALESELERVNEFVRSFGVPPAIE